MAGRAYMPHNSYSGNLAREKRRRFFIRLGAVVFCVVMLGAASVYALFYSGWLDINNISINGLKSVSNEEISPTINAMIEKNVVPVLKIRFQENTFFFNPEPVEEAILAQFPVIKAVDITKELPHKIIVNVTERVALGTWCLDRGCSYFDEDGILWGKALRSSGSLLLSVDDLRPGQVDTKVGSKLLSGIRELVSGLEDIGVKINRVEIPADSIGEFKVYTTKGYYLIFNLESNIKDQVNVLRILLKEKGKDFSPQYIDLKVEGRAYYR